MEHRGTGWHASRVRVTRPDTTGGARADGRTDRRPLVKAVRAVVPGTPPDRGRRVGERHRGVAGRPARCPGPAEGVRRCRSPPRLPAVPVPGPARPAVRRGGAAGRGGTAGARL